MMMAMKMNGSVKIRGGTSFIMTANARGVQHWDGPNTGKYNMGNNRNKS